MVISKNLYKPPKIMKYEKDQYPQSTYEHEGYIAYSWGKDIPKYNTEIDKTKLSYEANFYIRSVTIICLQISGTLVFNTNNEIGEGVIEDNTITFTCKPGSYSIPVDWKNRPNGESDLKFNYNLIVYPDRNRKEYLYVLDYLEQIKQYQNILDQFNSSVELWKEQNDENNNSDNHNITITTQETVGSETVYIPAISWTQLTP